MICPNATSVCHLMTSKSSTNERWNFCLGLYAIRDHLKMVINENEFTRVQFGQWLETDLFSVVTWVIPADDFADSFCNAYRILKPYACTPEQQALYSKGTVAIGEILVQCDFAENFGFEVQDSAKSFHWNSEQATLLISVFYYFCQRWKHSHDIGWFKTGYSNVLHFPDVNTQSSLR